MSKSLRDLLGGVKSNTIQPKENELVNPDIPDFNHEEKIRDQFYNNFRTPSQPRNGSGYMLPRQNHLINPVSSTFMADGDIDPNIIRSKIDPDSAMPSLSSQSAFSLMPESVRPSHDNVGLIKKSHQSEMNYANRFTPPQES